MGETKLKQKSKDSVFCDMFSMPKYLFQLYKTPFEDSTDKYGNYRTNRNVFMSGAGIMEFSLENVPGLVDSVLEKNNLIHKKTVLHLKLL